MIYMELDLTQFNTTELIILMVAGALLLFAGYRVKKIGFFVAWFIVGYLLMGFLMPTINNAVPEIAGNQLWQVLLPIAGGLLLAMLGFTIEKICVSLLTFAATMVVTVQYFGTEWMTLAIGGVVGVILGALAVKMMKPATILTTSLIGAYILTMALFFFVAEIDRTVFYWPILVGTAGIGALAQFMVTARNAS